MILFASIFFTGCASAVNWISPMLSFDVESNQAYVWDGEHNFMRTGTNNVVFAGTGAPAITADALLAGGAVRATVNIAYEGDGEFYTRLVAFTYEFFDHARLTTRMVPVAAQNAPILVLWQNPQNGHWFSIIHDTIGSQDATGSNMTVQSLRNPYPGGQNHAIRLNRDTIADFSEIEFFIVPATRPTRDNLAYTHTGYVVTFAIETPDGDNHFHIFETLVSSSTRIFVTSRA